MCYLTIFFVLRNVKCSICRGGYTVEECHELLSARWMQHEKVSERSIARRERGPVPVAQHGEELEGPVDYRLHNDQLAALQDHAKESRRAVGRAPIDEDSDATAAYKHKRNFFIERYHPLAASLEGFNERVASGALRSKANVTPVPPQLRDGY